MPLKSPAPRATRLDANAWIAAALDALADGGVDAVRVEPLAKRLGVTKGSFYWHFADRRALIQALLAHWRDGRIEAIRRQAQGPENPAAILRRLVGLYTQRANYRGLAIELAIRLLARRDETAGAAVRKVDVERLTHVTKLFRGLGWPETEAEARAVLLYSYLFGQPLLHGAAASAPLRQSAVATLIAPPSALLEAEPERSDPQKGEKADHVGHGRDEDAG